MTPSRRSSAWWAELNRSPTERLHLDVATLDHIEVQIATIDAERRRLSTSEPWAEHLPYLVQLPSIALRSAMTILGAVGDSTRFPSAKKLIGSAGLGVGFMTAARLIVTRVSPNRVGASCDTC